MNLDIGDEIKKATRLCSSRLRYMCCFNIYERVDFT
jgi:hypothetical protein